MTLPVLFSYIWAPDRCVLAVETVQVPEGVDWAALVKFAMDKYQVELAGGLGPTLGKIWRVGIMGYNATEANAELVVAAFRDGLAAQRDGGADGVTPGQAALLQRG